MACQLVLSGCHRAEIELGGAVAEMSDAGAREIAGGAGGAGADDTREMGGEGGGGAHIDTTPPRVLSISPIDGAVGVRSNAKVVIRFSEPMDRTQTERAVTIADVPATFSWDERGMELSLVPLQELRYGRGPDPENVDAIVYSLRVTGSARDVAGNALEHEHASTFYTSRELSTSLRGNDALIGYAVDSSNSLASSVYVDPYVGDAADESMKGFVTADLSRLPPDTQAVTSATLTVEQYAIEGEPYRMGNMLVEHVSFSALEFVFDAPVKESFGVLFRDPETKSASVNVTSALQTQLAERADEVGEIQFRFAFEEPAYANGISDEVRLRPLKINVSYLRP